MNRLLLAIVALACSTCFAQDITYKGVPLGAPLSDFKSRFPDHDCSLSDSKCYYLAEVCKAGFDVCKERNSFGGVRIKSAHSDFRDGAFAAVRMTFDARDFPSIRDAATEKLGTPAKVKNNQIQTRAGATLENSEVSWESKTMILRISKYGSNINEGYLSFTTPEEEARRIAEWEAKKKAGAKDF